MLPNEFIEFLKGLSDMELLALLSDARSTGDKQTVTSILVEIGQRKHGEPCPRCGFENPVDAMICGKCEKVL
jgi:hypothetical protein